MTNHIFLIGLPGGIEWLMMLVPAALIGGFLYFIFKAGQWRGEAKRNREKEL